MTTHTHTLSLPLTLRSPVSGRFSRGLPSHLYPPMHASSTESPAWQLWWVSRGVGGGVDGDL